MKKTALLAACLVLGTANAWAYENGAAGFSVKDGKPFYKMESAKLYAFSSFSADAFHKLDEQNRGSIHIVNYFNAAEMSKVLGVEYNDAYFAAEYAKLALLKRSQLDLRTLPSPLLDLKKYALANGKDTLQVQEEFFKHHMQQLGNIEPSLRIDERGKYKLITQSFLYRQDNVLNELDISLVAANNKLYMLTTITSDSKYFAADGAKAAKDEASNGLLELEQANKTTAPKISAVKPDSLPQELRNKLLQSHWQLIKSFAAFQPYKGKQALQFVDSYKGKAVVLPSNWVYGQLQFKEKKGAACLTMAAPVENLRKVFAKMDYFELYKHFAADATAAEANSRENITDTASKLPVLDYKQQSFVAAEGRKALHNFDSFLMTFSYQTKDKDFQDMADSALSSKPSVEMLLTETLNSLKNRSFDNFVLESYAYKLDHAPDKVQTIITGRSKLFNKYTYDNLLQLALSKNSGSILLYAHKPETLTAEELSTSINTWQF